MGGASAQLKGAFLMEKAGRGETHPAFPLRDSFQSLSKWMVIGETVGSGKFLISLGILQDFALLGIP